MREYANEKHEMQAKEFIYELGEFVLAFELVCESMRYNIIFMLKSQGLNNQHMAFAIIGDKSSVELQVLLGALYNELPNQDEEDRKIVRSLLKRVKDVTEKRNLLLHNSWNFGSLESWGKEILAVATRCRTKQNSGASIEPHGISPSYIRELRRELKEIYLLLQKLLDCVIKSKLKVSEELKI